MSKTNEEIKRGTNEKLLGFLETVIELDFPSFTQASLSAISLVLVTAIFYKTFGITLVRIF